MGTLKFIQSIHLTKVISLVSRMNNLELFTPKCELWKPFNNERPYNCHLFPNYAQRSYVLSRMVLVTTSTYRHSYYQLTVSKKSRTQLSMHMLSNPLLLSATLKKPHVCQHLSLQLCGCWHLREGFPFPLWDRASGSSSLFPAAVLSRSSKSFLTDEGRANSRVTLVVFKTLISPLPLQDD